MTGAPLTLAAIVRCFEGAVPAVVATAGADGVPNVTYLSRVQLVDGERVALSNQFFSKTARNLAENPVASVLLIDPITHDEYRMSLVYERTERRGPVFERLRADVDAIAALCGMQSVFRLRAADIYRVTAVEQCASNADAPTPVVSSSSAPDTLQLAELCGRMARCADLDALVGATVDGLDQLLGYTHVHLLLVAEDASRLYTIASRGFDAESVGAEVVVGDGVIGMAAQRGAPVRVGNLLQMRKYGRSVRRGFEDHGEAGPGHQMPMPGLPGAESRIAVPAMSGGQLVGVLAADRAAMVAFDERDEATLSVVAAVLASAVEALRVDDPDVAPEEVAPRRGDLSPVAVAVTPLKVRFFDVDGSVFLDGDYLIKGVAGRILWSLLRAHVAEGRVEFTNRELRLDPTLEMPGFKDNLESRLILLKRRLDEREGPIRMHRTGRGRFAVQVDVAVRLDQG